MTAWKNLERDVARFFGTERNVKRGMDYSIEDTDVDILPEDSGIGYPMIIDCKYRSDSEGNLCEMMRDWVKEMPKWVRDKEEPPAPQIIYATQRAWYLVMRMEDFLSNLVDGSQIDAEPWFSEGTAPLNWVKTIGARSDVKYIDEWFDKLEETYLPMKAEEFGFPRNMFIQAVAIRKRGVRQTVMVVKLYDEQDG